MMSILPARSEVPKVSSIPGVGVRGVSAVLSQDTVRGGQCSSVFVAQVVS